MSKARSFRRVFDWGSGADQREAAPHPQVEMVWSLVLVLTTPSDQIDSAMPEKTQGRLHVRASGGGVGRFCSNSTGGR